MSEERRPDKYKGKKCLGETRHRGNTKDTKRWCKGVVGREHQKAWVLDERYKRWVAYHFICTVCNKEFSYCFGLRWWNHNPCRCGHHDIPPAKTPE